MNTHNRKETLGFRTLIDNGDPMDQNIKPNFGSGVIVDKTDDRMSFEHFNSV